MASRAVLVVVGNGAVDQLGDLELREVAPRLLRRVLDDLEGVGGVLRRADRVQHHAVADLAGEFQAGPSRGRNVERDVGAQRLPADADVLELDELSVDSLTFSPVKSSRMDSMYSLRT